MLIKNINTEILYDDHTVNYLNHLYYTPHRQEIIAKIEAILDPDEYQDLMMLFKSQNSFGDKRMILADLIKNTVTEDVIQNNRENETFLLSLINSNTSIIVSGDTYSFINYAKTHLHEFAEKYKLLLNE